MDDSKEEYPISFEHIEPIFQFINMIIYDNVTEENDREGFIFGKKNEYLRSTFKDKRFPVKIEIPIYPTIKIMIKNIDCSLDLEKIPESLFEIPSNYEEEDIMFSAMNR